MSYNETGLILNYDLSTATDPQTVGLYLNATSSLRIDWGDGSEDTIVFNGTAAPVSHSYIGKPNPITIIIYGVSLVDNITKFGNTGAFVDGISFLKSVIFTSALTSLTNLSGAFGGAKNLTTITNSPPISVTDMSYMFNMFGVTGEVFNQDISSWNIDNVTNIDGMFIYNNSFNNGGQPLTWGSKTSNITNMYGVFLGATSFNVDISSWNVSKVINFREMFSLAILFNQPLNNWNINTNSFVSMRGMFSGATSFDQPLNNWNVSRVNNMRSMFYNTNFNQPLANWDVSGVTTMQEMFLGASKFNQDISNWNISNVTDMRYMFNGATSFNQNLGSWYPEKLTNAIEMFTDSGLSNINFDNLLIGWANPAKTSYVNGVPLGEGIYYTSAAQTAYNTLTSSYNWTIDATLLNISTIPTNEPNISNVGTTPFTLVGNSDQPGSYYYVITGPTQPGSGSFSPSPTGTMSSSGGNTYRGTVTYTPVVNYTGPATGSWYFRNTSGSIQSQSSAVQLTVTCLHSSTRVLTPDGYIPISELKKGDLVTTDDGRNVEITEITHSRMTDPNGGLLYCIPQDAIRPGYPPEDVLITNGHSVLLQPEKGNLEGEWISTLYLPKKYPSVVPHPSPEPFELYHLHLPSFFDDNLVVNGGFVVESQGDFKNIWKDTGKGDYTKYKDIKLKYL